MATRSGLGAELAPFVAWLATQDIDEPVRRELRAEVEDFLRWARSDPGPVSGRRNRYETHLAARQPTRLDRARAGLDRFAEYRAVLAVTLPIDHH